MRKFIFILTLLLSISCTSDSTEPIVMLNYTYNTQELEMLQLIKDYRTSQSLNSLSDKEHISALCEQSNNYMISYNDVKHYYFQDRVDNLKRIGYTRVSAIVCANFISNQGALSAMNVDINCHKIIIGDFTDFGVSIKTNSNGKKYYTLTFAKI